MEEYKNTPEGRDVTRKYADILALSRPGQRGEPPPSPPDELGEPGKDLFPLCRSAGIR